ncbi:MAG: enoyl-CoA hydratase-related protein [Rhodospirillaceae bacterium]|nr:enoyl-CoA hydratase-related protein [Rhodospirillaceae bacterium]
MTFNNLQFEVSDKIATITMNRPSALNALNDETLLELGLALTEIETNPAIKGAIITGSGKAFVAGADIRQMADYNPQQARAYMSRAQRVFNRIEDIEKPIMAAVNGFALGGGCELAMACDFRFGSEKAVFGQPEINLGVIPGFGGSQRLPRLTNAGFAKELLFSGRTVKADEAFRVGLISRLCTPEMLLTEARDIMTLIVSKPADALGYAKVAVNQGRDADLKKALELEVNLISLCFATEDQKEGMKAFLEKRPAKFNS